MKDLTEKLEEKIGIGWDCGCGGAIHKNKDLLKAVMPLLREIEEKWERQVFDRFTDYLEELLEEK